MPVETLRSWQHDIAERCTDEDEALDTTGITEIPNHVHRLQALVEYSLQDEVRAKVLLSLVRDTDPYLYKDLSNLGPRGKTERKLTQFKLTHAAEHALGSTLPTFHRAVRDTSFLDKIMIVDAAVNIMVQEELILADEQYMLYHMHKTTAGKACALRYLFGCPTVPDEAKASISLILAMYSLHTFGIFTNDPDSLLETVSIPSVGASVV
ncbi:hypothetical protein ACER0C_002993 [Sarotherodon galilaeus]